MDHFSHFFQFLHITIVPRYQWTYRWVCNRQELYEPHLVADKLIPGAAVHGPFHCHTIYGASQPAMSHSVLRELEYAAVA